MLSTILFALVAQSSQVVCPIMGSDIAKDSPVVEYAGAQFKFCCPGCDSAFSKEPAKALAEAAKNKETVGVFLFDPVSRNRLEIAKAKATLDHNGIRYPFESTANRDKFRSSPATYTAVPQRESLFCPVMQSKVASISKAAGYVDHNGVRYYTCCAGCNDPLSKEPARFVRNASQHVKAIGAHSVAGGKSEAAPHSDFEEITTATHGKYKIQLLVPEEGVFAGEEIDIEFSIVDTTKEDPDLGYLGVANLRATAVVTMPSMPGMPEARPNIHREGIPGYYGVELFFPHGGDYRIDLTLTPPNEEPFNIFFLIDVKDAEARTGAPRPKPFALEVVEHAKPQAGSPFDLKLKVRETKSTEVVTRFEIVHEERFHLLIASEDFGWFLHEHPTMNENGEWTQNLTFPAGGKFFIYGDVAPVGKGSQILITEIEVDGNPFPYTAAWNPNLGPSADGTVVGVLGFVNGEPPIGRMTTLSVTLTDKETGKPVTDLQQWLGAWGHLMIFSKDGMTVVHSHPAENEDTEKRLKEGVIHFTGRFPKPGLYRAFSQFKRGGEIKTLSYTLEIKQ
ncbi:MAG: FixH family protein [Fimbriimonadales bacterium]|nr:FixH family protein [Fimbriimonadales bacterium]